MLTIFRNLDQADKADSNRAVTSSTDPMPSTESTLAFLTVDKAVRRFGLLCIDLHPTTNDLFGVVGAAFELCAVGNRA